MIHSNYEDIITKRMAELDQEIWEAVEHQKSATEYKEFWEKVEEQKILTYMELKRILEKAAVEKIGPYEIQR